MNKFNCVALFIFSIYHPASWAAYNLELKGGYESWKTGLGVEANAVVGGVGLAYYQDKYFAGGGFVLGDYVVQGDSDKSLSRSDLDMVIGYQVDPQWSLFTGYRFNQFRYTSLSNVFQDLTQNTLGLGVGASFIVPLANTWVAFGTASTSGLYSYNNFSENGKGYAIGVEGGVLYSFNPKTTFALRVKSQVNYYLEDRTDWNYSYVRYGAHLGYSF